MALNASQRSTVIKLAKDANLPPDVVLGLVDKESAGVVTWNVDGKLLPPIRPETHKFYSFLRGSQLDAAIKAGLAAKKAGAIKIPNSGAARYAFLERMQEINETAALMSISMGIGQVMGFNHKLCGFVTVQDMWAVAKQGFGGQVSIMLKFIESQPAIQKAMHDKDYVTIARLYNGPAWKKNNYASELEKFTNKYTSITKQGTPVYVQPDTGDDYDTRIQDLGYKSVKDFQLENGLEADGKIGQITRNKVAEVEAARKKQIDKPANTSAKAAAVASTIGLVAAGADQINTISDTMSPIVGTATVIGSYGPTVVISLAVIAVVAAVSAFVYFKFIKK